MVFTVLLYFLFYPGIHPEAKVQQIDLCPTLSVLLGLPIPANNLGSVLPSALPEKMPLRDKVRSLQINAHQISKVLEENVDDVIKGKYINMI